MMQPSYTLDESFTVCDTADSSTSDLFDGSDIIPVEDSFLPTGSRVLTNPLIPIAITNLRARRHGKLLRTHWKIPNASYRVASYRLTMDDPPGCPKDSLRVYCRWKCGYYIDLISTDTEEKIKRVWKKFIDCHERSVKHLQLKDKKNCAWCTERNIHVERKRHCQDNRYLYHVMSHRVDLVYPSPNILYEIMETVYSTMFPGV